MIASKKLDLGWRIIVLDSEQRNRGVVFFLFYREDRKEDVVGVIIDYTCDIGRILTGLIR